MNGHRISNTPEHFMNQDLVSTIQESEAMCAHICIACGNECSNFPDQMSQQCALICFTCAQHCNDFASGKM